MMHKHMVAEVASVNGPFLLGIAGCLIAFAGGPGKVETISLLGFYAPFDRAKLLHLTTR
jgi:hypothetical protein